MLKISKMFVNELLKTAHGIINTKKIAVLWAFKCSENCWLVYMKVNVLMICFQLQLLIFQF